MKLPHFFFFLAFVFTTNCAGTGPLSPALREQLQAEYDKKLQLLREVSESNIAGWPADNECDGALWAGLARSAGAHWIDMAAALRPDGRPTRKPLRDCVTPDESHTTTSNDMITGILLGLHVGGDAGSILRLYKYGEAHNWIMGYPEDYVSRVLLRPNGITLLARSLYKLSGGKIDYAIRHAPLVYGPMVEDYEAHLALVGRYLQRRVGGPTFGADVTEKILARREPSDALAQAMAGYSNISAALLLNNYKSPHYVRGHESYHLVHWLFAARIALDN